MRGCVCYNGCNHSIMYNCCLQNRRAACTHPFDVGLRFDLHNSCRFFPEKATTIATDILNELLEVSSIIVLQL